MKKFEYFNPYNAFNLYRILAKIGWVDFYLENKFG